MARKKSSKKKATKKTAPVKSPNLKVREPEPAAKARPPKPAGLARTIASLPRGSLLAAGPGRDSVVAQAAERGFKIVTDQSADHVFVLGAPGITDGLTEYAVKTLTVCMPGTRAEHQRAVRKALGPGARYIGQVGDCAAFQLIK